MKDHVDWQHFKIFNGSMLYWLCVAHCNTCVSCACVVLQKRPALDARIKELIETDEGGVDKEHNSAASNIMNEDSTQVHTVADSSEHEEEDPIMDDDELHSLLGV